MSPPDPSPLVQLPNTYRAFYGSFTGLYPIQQQAISPVLVNSDLIIQSATGSGKTEAVLAPCLERIIASGMTRAALYIVPTRALAFDIRRRFADTLKERLGVSFAIRTGDVKKSGGRPDIMLTTPESLDVMLGSANADLLAFLLRVRTVIIDEVHPFIHQYRGQQLSCLLHRLERRIGQRLQKIALSATIADPHEVQRFFNFRADFVLLTENVRRQIHPRLIHLKDDEDELVNLLADLAEEWQYRKILIFANSRGRCDKIFGLLNRQGAFKGMAHLHYSNLKAKERQIVEQRFRRQTRAVCVATSTLELGIDVGDVDAVLLFEPPDSVSAFLQRIGRANRRQDTIHFWGICRGGLAGEQLLRFLALLQLAEEGRVEAALPKTLPSVLSQQFISCLYEKKRLTLAVLQDLFFSSSAAETEEIFAALIKKSWLKKSTVNGLYSGGWRYWQALVEHEIWSNFPENEDLYQLVVEGESVAEIPKSIVRQLEPGDRVPLAGRRLRIVGIDEGECKRVLAEPVRQLDDKELAWLGKGSHVSHEVAQAMRAVLKSADKEDNEMAPGLFSRSRELIRQELEKDKKAVLLDNTIEVVRLVNGSYHYRTFIGAVGNLVLARSIKEFYARKKESVQVAADEIGVICSGLICFEELALPVTDDDFTAWISRRFKMMRPLFPLNAFCATLPAGLLCLELASFFRDDRLLDFFKLCKSKTSAIVKGDPENLNLPSAADGKKVMREIPSQAASLLASEKKRWLSGDLPVYLRQNVASDYQPKAISGTIIGDYFRHQQCDRWFSLQFLRPEEQPFLASGKNDDVISALRQARGLEFEEKILSHLHRQNKIFRTIAAKDAAGHGRLLNDRFDQTVDCFKQLGKEEHLATGLSGSYIVHPVLSVDSVLALSQPTEQLTVPGVGIPDLIQLRVAENANFLSLQIGDIKGSSRPRYYQKWQVAFYAWLLQQVIDHNLELAHLKVADCGFLLTPSGDADFVRRHVFDLKPYLTAIKALWLNLNSVLAAPPLQACWQLQKHCVSCPAFLFCYQQALNKEEVQFIPGLSRGSMEKMRILAVNSLQQDVDLQTAFSPLQKNNIHGAINALRDNKIIIGAGSSGASRTDLFPVMSTAFVVHLVVDPVSGLPAGFGLAMQARGKDLDVLTWRVEENTRWPVIWQEFSCKLLKLWHGAIENGRGPHILLFGSSTRSEMRHWAGLMGDRQMADLFAAGNNCHSTDLQQVLTSHFALPLPGTITLFALNRILGLSEIDLPVPESLLHVDRFADMKMSIICQLVMELWHWIVAHLTSRRQKDDWRLPRRQGSDLADSCRQFIETERQHHERDIAGLMELSLAERVARFRALGPLDFTGTTLDEEGKFLYLFSVSAEADGAGDLLTKFRSGDFLKLVPLGITDLQSGMPVILADFNSRSREVALYLRQGSMGVSQSVPYSLEEDGEDFYSAKLLDVTQKAFASDNMQIGELFGGMLTHKMACDEQWLQGWLNLEAAPACLNSSQQQALRLPFQYGVSLVNGPPGTGKTNLLGWIIVALMRRAQADGTPLRVAVCALTHRAIDQVLSKVVSLVNRHELADFPARCFKWGTWEGENFDPGKSGMQVEPCNDAGGILGCPYLIVGATGYGLDKMLKKHGGSDQGWQKPFDWVIFDEASQILIPQSLLALIHGKGNFLFLGDVRQLPPIIRSAIFKDEADDNDGGDGGDGGGESFAAATRCSVLEILLRRYPHQSQLLDITYRMNTEICRFPSRTWYDGLLHASAANAGARLVLPGLAKNDFLDDIVDPNKPVVLVGVNHHGCGQKSTVEAELLAFIAKRLLHDHKITPAQMAIISPHRAQNNAIAASLAEMLGGYGDLPVIDTVERMQGAERDVILFGFTCSDPDQIFSEFLNNPNRFNVVLTRARQKLIVIGSKVFFESVAPTEKQLQANACFKEFFAYCRGCGCYFEYSESP